MGRLTETWKTRLLAGVAACAVSGAVGIGPVAYAQSAATPPKQTAPNIIDRLAGRDHASTDPNLTPPKPVVPLAQTPADTLMGNSAFYMEADTIVRDDENHLWTAKGNVEARYQGRTMRADEIVYNTVNGVVTARGKVQLVNPDGTDEFADAMTADKDFTSGISLAFSSRQKMNAKLIADEAVRLNKDAMELNKAVFTVCDICAPDGSPEAPTWSIQAEQVIQDHKRQLVYYKHVVIRVKGVPVLAAPVFWHVDPTAKRGSGLLAPKIALDSRRGFSYEQPYLLVIDPSQDLVISPQFNTKVAPFLEGEYRKRFWSGQVDARFGYTDDAQFDSNGKRFDNVTSRSYILAQGAWAPTRDWTYGFSAERVTDPLLFNRYNVPNTQDQRGLYSTDDKRLLSQIYAVEQSGKSYFSVTAMSFQGIRDGDLNGTFPLIAPLVETHLEPDWKILGGVLKLDGGGVILQRDRDIVTDTAPGVDSRRATFGGAWNSNYTFSDGIRLQPFLNARTDVYNVDQISLANPGDHTTSRLLATAGVDASWPFFKRTGDMTVILEPLAQIALSPAARANPLIPNEDSQVFDFDETTLFEANKSPGFDYYEGGARANVGGRATVRWDSGGSAQFLVGRSYRAAPDPTLPVGTSLNQTQSDWVVAASVQPNNGFSAYTRSRLDSQTGHINTLEVGLNGAVQRANGFFRFLYDNVDTPGVLSENVQAGAQFLITPHWGFTGSTNWDIAGKVPVLQEFGLLYQDECTHWELVYQHDGTFDRQLHPSDKIILRLLLVQLGGNAYQRPDFR
jgi:LPS-assembly protein